MKILFAHPQPFAQFGPLARHLIAQGWDVRFAHRFGPDQEVLDGIPLVRFDAGWPVVMRPGAVGYATEYAGVNALGFLRMALSLRDAGYVPDIVMAHVGWGVSLCVKDVSPECRYVAYHEWYNRSAPLPDTPELRAELNWINATTQDRLRNMPIMAEFLSADANWAPTRFQADRFPPLLRPMVEVVPDGVDAAFYTPKPGATFVIDGLDLGHVSQLVTYATRGMEPLRGFPAFIKALARLQQMLPDMHAVIAGRDRVFYGDQLPQEETWRGRMMDEHDLDLSRVHFTGFLDPDDYRLLLQASDAHVYFSTPFVTSWSLAEALMTGCLVVGSDTENVREFVRHDETGVLVDMTDSNEVVETLHWALTTPTETRPLRQAARAQMQASYAATTVLPEKEHRLRALATAPRG